MPSSGALLQYLFFEWNILIITRFAVVYKLTCEYFIKISKACVSGFSAVAGISILVWSVYMFKYILL